MIAARFSHLILMIEKRERDFLALSIKARECLERPLRDLPHHQLKLRLWHYPSFECHSSWLLYCPFLQYRQVENPIVVRVVWDQPLDGLRFRDPLKGLEHGFSIEPSTSLRQSEIPAKQVNPMLAALVEIGLPLSIDDESVGLDGESFGVETFGLKQSMCLQWWGEGCVEWKPLVDWARELRFLFEQFLERPLTTTAI
jgi:hypothetical protein